MKTLLAEAFDLKINSLTRMGNGKSAEIFLADEEIVFKVGLASDTSDSSLDLEYEVLCALQGKMEIAIPKPLYLGALPDGRKVLGESLVSGIQFSQELYEEFSQHEKDALFAHMGEIFCQLHSAKIPPVTKAFKWDDAENFADFKKYYTDEIKNALTRAEQARIQKIADDFAAAVKNNPVPVVLCHGDLHFWNLNYDPAAKKICGLLDFGCACYNDPLNDMRYFWSDTTAKMLRAYRGDFGKNATERHLFYCMCNSIESASIDSLKRIIFQEP